MNLVNNLYLIRILIKILTEYVTIVRKECLKNPLGKLKLRIGMPLSRT